MKRYGKHLTFCLIVLAAGAARWNSPTFAQATSPATAPDRRGGTGLPAWALAHATGPATAPAGAVSPTAQTAPGATASAPAESGRPSSAPATAPAEPKAPAGLRAVTIDGESFPGRLSALTSSEATFATPAGQRKVALRDLWQVPVAEHEDALARRGQKVLLLDDGGVLAFDTIAVAEGKVALEGPAFGKAALEMSAASALYFPAREQTPAGARKRHLEMNLPAANTDFLVVEDGKARWVPVAGVLKGIEGGKVSFQFEGENRTTDLSAVRVIQLARVPRKAAAPAGRLTCRDGSEAAFAALSFDGTCFSAAADGMALPAVDTAAVAEIRFQSDRFVYLSDLKPAQVSQAGMFELVFPFRADRSSAGRPLRLGKTVYAKGVGMHSRCELTYDLHGKYATFAALAGIDATGGTRGNAALRILGDGRELLPALKLLGGAAAIPLRCAVSGVKQLTVIADFGEDATDIGDHVDLADARLIKP